MKNWICLILACALAACSTNAFGPPDDPAEAIPPSRPSPFEGGGSGGASSPWSGSGIDTAGAAAPQSSR